jgi:hypothetical protein
MSIPLFKTVENYAKMLDKIAVSTFIVLCICIYQIIYNVSGFYTLLNKYLMEIDLLGFKMPMAVVVSSIVLASISQAIKLHNRISDVFRIRDKYDLFQILYPLAIGTTSKITHEKILKIKVRRKNLMDSCFYKYASSKEDNPLIDKHLITMAINQLSWYWMVIESIFILFLTSIVFLIVWQPVASLIFILIANILLLVCIPLLGLCKEYTRREIEVILASQNAKTEIEGVFNAL